MDINGAALNTAEINGSSGLLFLLREYAATALAGAAKVGVVGRRLLAQSFGTGILRRGLLMSVSALVTGATAKIAGVRRAFSATSLVAPVLSRVINRVRAAAATGAATYADVFAYARILLCSATGQGTYGRTIGKLFLGTTSVVAVLQRAMTRAVAALAGIETAIMRTTSKGFLAAVTGGGTTARAYLRQFLAAATQVASVATLSITARVFAATSAAVVTVNRALAKRFAASVSTGVSRLVTVGKALAATVTVLPDATRTLYRTLLARAYSAVGILLGYVRSFGASDPATTTVARAMNRSTSLPARIRSTVGAAVSRVSTTHKD